MCARLRRGVEHVRHPRRMPRMPAAMAEHPVHDVRRLVGPRRLVRGPAPLLPMSVSATPRDDLRLTGSGGANRVMEAELKRLVMRSPFDVRLEKPKREGEATLLYPFDARVAWVAGCHHRTSSRITWDLCSSAAVRLEPLFDDLLPLLASDDRLPGPTPPPPLGRGRSLVRLRGVTAPAPGRRQERGRRGAGVTRRRVRGRRRLARRRVRRAPRRNARNTANGGWHRHRRRSAASPRRARSRGAGADARDHGGATRHVVALGRAD